MSKKGHGLPADIKYSIFDPTGNITALVESSVDISLQPDIAAEIMKMHPEVEQVGFVRFDEACSEAPVQLRMAGGEFCGNAAMCAAALYAVRRDEDAASAEISVSSSGVSGPLRVRLSRSECGAADNSGTGSTGSYLISYDTEILMPPALRIEKKELECRLNGKRASGRESIVHMPGIDHIVVTQHSGLYDLSSSESDAETAIREFCSLLGSDCLGLMFLNTENGEYELKPLVYVPGADTVFWENSCASGTAAVGMYLANENGCRIDISAAEPAGILRVTSDPLTGETRLYGDAKLIR